MNDEQYRTKLLLEKRLHWIETRESKVKRQVARMEANVAHMMVFALVGLLSYVVSRVVPMDTFVLLPLIPLTILAVVEIEKVFKISRSYRSVEVPLSIW